MQQPGAEAAFIRLFVEACRVGLGHALTAPLSETDSKVLAAAILEQTGLVVGSKSLKNYALYVLSPTEGKKENPSAATLDTLARFVLQAPRTDEAQRKAHESHYPYWFRYRSSLAPPAAPDAPFAADTPLAAASPIPAATAAPAPAATPVPAPRQRLPYSYWWLGAALVLGGLALGLGRRLLLPPAADFQDSFASLAADSLQARGWTLQHPDSIWWARRAARPGTCALYTLPGASWPSEARPAAMRNLLVRQVAADCFSAEIHLDRFFPTHNWQQAGLLLAENEKFTGRLLRLSLSYNDYFGGYARPPEIVLQGLSSAEADSRSKPEEFAHVPLFTLLQPADPLVATNLRKSALKIEKKGRHFRFLYATGSMESFAFTEAASGTFTIEPRYLALFATQGAASVPHVAPACFDSFSLVQLPCAE